jgi:hypothetical protein
MLGDGAGIRNNCGKHALTSPTKETNNLPRTIATVIFLNWNDLKHGCAELIEHGFDVQYPNDCLDEGTPKVWVNVPILTDIPNKIFFNLAKEILGPVGGKVYGIVNDACVTGLPSITNFRSIAD